MQERYTAFFNAALCIKNEPYPYQVRLATHSWPDTLNVPTGLGKTAAIIVAWLFKRNIKDVHTPRRLIYCLPMRVLVEQTAHFASQWVHNLLTHNKLTENQCPSVYTLMGGQVNKDWDLYPERDAIIIGTQDQLLSRALNRGYSMSRFRWPVSFGLLNNDCFWVFDEIQLMGPGLVTSTQLESFRRFFGTHLTCRSLWMSATINPESLYSIDFKQYKDELTHMGLSEKDRKNKKILSKVKALKKISRAQCNVSNTTSVGSFIISKHKPNTKTLVVVNTVKRALEIYQKTELLLRKHAQRPNLFLLHSRFRPQDRLSALNSFMSNHNEAGSICITTQVIEAGLDFSATTLITDLATWSSMIQRFGRCNRYGKDSGAQIFWLDILAAGNSRIVPYQTSELEEAKDILSELEGKDACPDNLPPVSKFTEPVHVLRKKDLLDLFDTTPDLSGMDVDVSRFIRETADFDVQVFWRAIEKGKSPFPSEASPSKKEFCSVPIADLKGRDCWIWDHLDERWVNASSLSPGMVVMLRQADGGYNRFLGWTGNSKDIPELLKVESFYEEGYNSDPWASINWQTLDFHTDRVIKELSDILSNCNIPPKHNESLITAARWHDAGKCHSVCQQAMLGTPPEADPSLTWAKTSRKNISYSRKGFRHELASAIALLENGYSDLSAYLAASHHGKVRLSIRSLPHEGKQPNGIRFARGIWDGDVLKETLLASGEMMPETVMNLSYMEIGEDEKGASWLSRMLMLRDSPEIGPFRLAFMEALLRCADWRASAEGNDDSE